jgi:hypothetical protein
MQRDVENMARAPCAGGGSSAATAEEEFMGIASIGKK